MTLQDYVHEVVSELEIADGKELPGYREVSFDVGIAVTAGGVKVDEASRNRITFTLEVKRG